MKTITLQSLLLSIILTSCNSSKVNNNLDGSIDLNNFETVTIESDAKKLTHLICLGKQLKTEIESVKEELSSKEAELKAKQDAKFAIESVGGKFDEPYNFNAFDSIEKHHRPILIEDEVELNVVIPELDSLSKVLDSKYKEHPIELKNLETAIESFSKNCQPITLEQRQERRSKLDFDGPKNEYKKLKEQNTLTKDQADSIANSISKNIEQKLSGGK